MDASGLIGEQKSPVQAGPESAVARKAGPGTSGDTTPIPTESPPFRPEVHSIAPVFSTSNLTRWIKHYRALGFTVSRYGDEYGFASLDSVEIHVSVNPDHAAATAGCAYLRVADADAVHAQWAQVEGGHGPAPVDTAYGLREGGHIDPDGNLIRYGSLIGGGGSENRGRE